MSPLLRAYLAFSMVSDPLWRLAMRRRVARGKEDAGRVGEKFAQGYGPRPEGEVIWFHALSVGEALALIPLIERALAARPGAHVLLTTSTASSVAALGRMDLPPRVIHVLLPVDTRRAARAFLDHWRPAVAVVAEIDLWPRLLVETAARAVPLLLINARIYEGSVESRARLGGLMRDLLGLFDAILVQDATSADRFADLGADPDRIAVAGALKAAARPLPVDEAALRAMRDAVGTRPLWLAAATEASEHPAVIEAHRAVLAQTPGALLIVAPRHIADAPGLLDLAENWGMAAARRSTGGAIGAGTDVYVADTIGEMGLWYRLAPVAFVGHSLPGRGLTGKNPFEAAALGCAILTGPDTADFAESFEALRDEGALGEVTDAAGIARAVTGLTPTDRARMADAARRVVEDKRGVLDVTWAVIEARLG